MMTTTTNDVNANHNAGDDDDDVNAGDDDVPRRTAS